MSIGVFNASGTQIGTIKKGEGGTLIYDPPDLKALARKPQLLKLDVYDYLKSWSNGWVSTREIDEQSGKTSSSS